MDILPKKLHTVHFVGIKGVAMTALAIYCKEKGMAVTGSDVTEDFPTKESLIKAKIRPLEGFSPGHIDPKKKPDLVIYTGAHNGADNVEVVTAKNLGIPVMPHGRALGFFMDGSVQVSVAGSHGKTTTSAMIATILTKVGRDPSYAIGCGEITGVGFAGHYGKGKEFIAEADEYVTDPGHDPTPRFLWQKPEVLVVTNIDFDHPDVYESLKSVQDAFVKLEKNQTGRKTTVINADDPASSVLSSLSGNEYIRYGFSKTADLRISDVVFSEGKTVFHVDLRGMPVGEDFILHVPGKHNVVNACAAMAASFSLGLSWNQIRDGLSAFGGTKRRFEYKGEVSGMKIFDDYAHHPHEIIPTLEAVRSWYPQRRIITIFQPHTYSRTKALFPLFSRCFDRSTIVCIADIYASAREAKNSDVTSSQLVEAIAKEKKDVWYVKDYDGAVQFLKKHGAPGDIVIFMGAGDIYDWGGKIINN